MKVGNIIFKDDVKFLRNKFFKKINKHETYILDSNVVLKFRDLFYSPNKMDFYEIEYWIGLLEFFKYKDVMPGAAIQELSWDFEKCEIDKNKLNRLGFAIDSLFSYDECITQRIKKMEHFCGETKPIKGSKRKLNSLYLNSEANTLLLATFCIMLKFYHVMEIYDDNKIRYTEICKFINNDLKLLMGYELAFIADILFSPDALKTNSIKELLKIDLKFCYMKKIWNSSWDIFFLRSITAFAANTISESPTESIYNPILVTRDKSLYIIGEFVNSKDYYTVINKQVYPGIEFGNYYSKENLEFIKTSLEILNSTKEERRRFNEKMSYDEMAQYYKIIIKKLESELSFILLTR